MIEDGAAGQRACVPVRIEPAGIELNVPRGQAVMAAAIEQGLPWPTSCGGKGICTLCVVRVLAGLEFLPPPNAAEREALRRTRNVDVTERPEMRLPCQFTVNGTVTLRKAGIRWPAPPRPEESQ